MGAAALVKERPGEVDRQHPVPVVVGGFQHRREHGDAGIVDQRVEPAEALSISCHRGRHRIGIGDVAMQGNRIVGIRKCGDRAVQHFALDVEQRHAPAFGKKPFRHRKADATPSTGDQRDLLQGGGHVDGNPYVGVPKKVYSAETNFRNSVFTRSSTFA